MIVKPPVTQLDEYGCGVACVAFLLDLPYRSALDLLGAERARTFGFLCSELAGALGVHGRPYYARSVNLRLPRMPEGSIAFVPPSSVYPAGHYLARHAGRWADSWANFPVNRDIRAAVAGYRRSLPSRPSWGLLPES